VTDRPRQDPPRCDYCDRPVEYAGDLDDEGRCKTCAVEAAAEREHRRQLRADYNWGKMGR
jgi:tRNA(Ile2) C34 agmatinyltransferase TiaS